VTAPLVAAQVALARVVEPEIEELVYHLRTGGYTTEADAILAAVKAVRAAEAATTNPTMTDNKQSGEMP
jgi:CYTH domain-containing protein